ncbi:MAG TPA: DUF1653 domain-containing protein [Lachnospiraceae bacterium]|nr:DUF1653 domain-containing protein [Lachnospiraceae bacterium]
MREEPKEFQVYRHFRGTYYQVLSVATHTETGERLVVYRSLYEPAEIYARPLEMFMSEISYKLYPDALNRRYRFELVTGDAKEPELREKMSFRQITRTEYEDYDESVIDPDLEKFLDEKSYEKKLDLLMYLRKKADDEMLNTIAMSLDLELTRTTTEEKYEEVFECLKTLGKYECNRLR